LVDFIEIDTNLEAKFEGAFERDEIMELFILNLNLKTSFHLFSVI
jgi:hypothetical protein